MFLYIQDVIKQRKGISKTNFMTSTAMKLINSWIKFISLVLHILEFDIATL